MCRRGEVSVGEMSWGDVSGVKCPGIKCRIAEKLYCSKAQQILGDNAVLPIDNPNLVLAYKIGRIAL